MIPMSPNNEAIERRLAHQRELLAELRSLHPLTADRLSAEPLVRAAVERIMQAVVDLALDINGHIASSVLNRSPATGRESFDLMVAAGALDAAHVESLKPAVGLRNILVHMYADIDTALIAGLAQEFEQTFSDYVRAVARWVLDRT